MDYSYLSTRRLWKCKDCKKQYSVKVGTIFEDSPIKLGDWMVAAWMVANRKNGVSSHELARTIGVQQKSAWFVLHRIRLAMQTGSFEKYSEKFDGAVEVDETYIGGKARNMKASRRKKVEGMEDFGKTGVMGFRSRDGEVAVTIMEGKSRSHLQREVRKRVKLEATVITDENKGIERARSALSASGH